MYNIHTFRKRNSLKSPTSTTKKSYKNSLRNENQFNSEHATLVPPETYPYDKNPLIQAIHNKDVNVDEIYDTLVNRTKYHGRLDVKPMKYSRERPQSASVTVGASSDSRKKRPRSAVQQNGGGDAAMATNAAETASRPATSSRPQSATFLSSTFITGTASPITGKPRSRPQSAIERTLRRPSSALGGADSSRLVRPMSASGALRKSTVAFNTTQQENTTTSRPASASSNAARYKTRSGLDLRRPSSSYRSQSATQRIVHVLPVELQAAPLNRSFHGAPHLDESHFTNTSFSDDEVIQVMESVAEDCLNNFEQGKDVEKWTIGRRGKFSNEPRIEWMGSEQERQEAYDRQLREAAWEQAQNEKHERDAMEYIKTKQQYRKQRALFKAQQQRNMIKTVVLVKEPRTVQQLEQILKEPIKRGTNRPQSALAYSSRTTVQDENVPPTSVFNTSRRRPGSARPRTNSYKTDRMEWEESLENSRNDLAMLDKFEARQRIEEAK